MPWWRRCTSRPCDVAPGPARGARVRARGAAGPRRHERGLGGGGARRGSPGGGQGGARRPRVGRGGVAGGRGVGPGGERARRRGRGLRAAGRRAGRRRDAAPARRCGRRPRAAPRATCRRGRSSPCWRRWPPRWGGCTTSGWCTVTSRRATCCSTSTGARCSVTSGSATSWATSRPGSGAPTATSRPRCCSAPTPRRHPTSTPSGRWAGCACRAPCPGRPGCGPSSRRCAWPGRGPSRSSPHWPLPCRPSRPTGPVPTSWPGCCSGPPSPSRCGWWPVTTRSAR